MWISQGKLSIYMYIVFNPSTGSRSHPAVAGVPTGALLNLASRYSRGTKEYFGIKISNKYRKVGVYIFLHVFKLLKLSNSLLLALASQVAALLCTEECSCYIEPNEVSAGDKVVKCSHCYSMAKAEWFRYFPVEYGKCIAVLYFINMKTN